MIKKRFFPYYIFMFNGIFNTLLSLVLIEIASKYGIATYEVGYGLTVATVVQAFAVFINGFILDKVDLKKEAFVALFFVLIGIVGIGLSPYFTLFITSYSVAMFGVGLLFSLSNYLIFVFYDEKLRASKYAVLNFFYTVGAVFGPMIAGMLMEAQVKWEMLYGFAGIFLLMSYSHLKGKVIYHREVPEHLKNESNPKRSKKAYIAGMSLLIYELSEITFGLWLVTYLRENLLFSERIAGISLSLFWVFMGIGRLLSSYLLKKISCLRYIQIFSVGSILSLLMMLNLTSVTMIVPVVGVIGLMYSGLFPVIVSYGTENVVVNTSKVMSFILTFGTIGMMLANPVSSIFVDHFGLEVTLYSSTIFMAIVFILMIRKRENS